jgi:hypothetical protein
MATLLDMGAPDPISVVIRQSLVKLRTPDDRGGRVFAANSMFTPTSNHLVTLRAGTAAALFGDPAGLIDGRPLCRFRPDFSAACGRPKVRAGPTGPVS